MEEEYAGPGVGFAALGSSKSEILEKRDGDEDEDEDEDEDD
jgi:hypothetical protein